ncbi:hypothetical protein [Paraliomyxa miuraensis]|uniref:hypothetical protein n=1 Tax=Paraliomyxa miuraensis TaxID=376150 RepID=UPI0022541C94|nr:hypothetical protein [Paraliomyxa miuraensis]MCX4247219.1 hypothetical protein [Paraliomyxa miuraensis]
MLTRRNPLPAHLCVLTFASACFSPIVTPLDDEGSTGTTGSPSSSEASTFDASTGGDGLDEGSSSGEVAYCGNGQLDPGEVCDDGTNDGAYGGCANDCLSLAPYCGDGLLDQAHGEACDDGDDVDGNGCNIDCIVSGTPLWDLHYDAGGLLGDDESRAMAVAPDDTVLVASGAHLQDGMTLRRYTNDGELMYSVPVSLERPRPFDLDVSNAFTVGIAGHQQGLSEPWILGFTIDGANDWNETYPVPSYSRSITALSDGGFVVSGDATGLAWLRRFGSVGNVVWTEELPMTPGFLSVASDPGGSFVVAGQFGPSAQLWLRKYSISNAELWTHIHPEHPGATNVSIGDDGWIYVIGTDWPTYEWWVTAFDSDGVEQWSTRFSPADPAGWADAQGVVAAPGGGAFVVGSYSDPSEDVQIQSLIQRYDPNGNLQWEQRVGSPYKPSSITIQSAGAVDLDSHGRLFVAGSLDTDDGDDTWLAKFAP